MAIVTVGSNTPKKENKKQHLDLSNEIKSLKTKNILLKSLLFLSVFANLILILK